ncbi:ROK family protein [Paramicrobacterium agarici]|uniref:Fructokinase n=1 Tax=Paramicrobacterium agarici TaxID=630514 RepID=A0A2A9DVT3_9MICO|nr:ROK family protein [Microbacterium agarici]PFG30694.1 fructokinase [Microbacterium agarici]
MIAAIETGGTKVVCGIVREEQPQQVVHSRRISTTTPSETIGAINEYLDEASRREPISALGVASFGPVNVESGRDRYGWVTGTPKQGWADTDLLGRIPLADDVPTAFLSDVASAALGEQTWGAGASHERVAYATFGTGVGVGIIIDGELLHGNGYPELGHVLVRRHPEDSYEGSCTFHGDCLEGLASGPAIMKRWGAETSSLSPQQRERAFEIVGYYIAQLATTTAYATGVEKFVAGGGVLKAQGLLESARLQLATVSGGRGASHAASLDQPDFLVSPELGDFSGLLGAAAAALRRLES